MSISLCAVSPADEGPFLAAVGRSRSLLADWVDPPSTRERFTAHLNRYAEDNHFSYLAKNSAGQLVGCINVNEIVRGSFQSAYLGYYAFSPENGKGFMKEALSMVLSLAFGELGLHRLEANIQPKNVSSIALVKSLGFRLEGYSPRYLKICGQWQDHERHALTSEEWTERVD